MTTTSADVRPTRLEVDLDAVRANVARLAEVTSTPVCAVVKADGYGHGAVPVARAALEAGASWLAVALVEEGRQLRDAGIDAPVLLLSEPPVEAADAVLDAGLAPMVYRPAFLAALAAAARRRGTHARVHLKLDTGMGRVGAPPAAWEQVASDLRDHPELDVEGVATHLARADEPELPTTDQQLAVLDAGLAVLAELGLHPRIVHAANTAGALAHPAARRDLVRVGIGVYGLSPSEQVDAADAGLRPALRVTSAVSYVKRVPAGTPVSYGHRWHAPADGWLATVPIGYADGVPRRLTGAGEALLGGHRRPIAGTVTMDQLVVWCGDHRPTEGDEVVLLGRQGDAEVRVEDWAAWAGTITYEVATQLTARLPRRHLGA